MTTQTHVCSVAGCPEPVTLMTSLNGNPMRAYCRTHGPVVYTVPAQPAAPAQPDPAALRAVALDFARWCLDLPSFQSYATPEEVVDAWIAARPTRRRRCEEDEGRCLVG